MPRIVVERHGALRGDEPGLGVDLTRADLGFYKRGCPIHLKGAPKVERRRYRGRVGPGDGDVPPPHKLFVSLISKW